MHHHTAGRIRDRYFPVDSSLRQTKSFKPSAVYFSPGLCLKIDSLPPEKHLKECHTQFCELPVSPFLLFSFYTEESQVALPFDLLEVHFHSHHESWADTGAIQGLLTCQSSHPQWQTGKPHYNASKVSMLSSWLPELDAVQAAELCWTADVLHCGCFTHFLGGELLALLEE